MSSQSQLVVMKELNLWQNMTNVTGWSKFWQCGWKMGPDLGQMTCRVELVFLTFNVQCKCGFQGRGTFLEASGPSLFEFGLAEFISGTTTWSTSHLLASWDISSFHAAMAQCYSIVMLSQVLWLAERVYKPGFLLCAPFSSCETTQVSMLCFSLTGWILSSLQ